MPPAAIGSRSRGALSPLSSLLGEGLHEGPWRQRSLRPRSDWRCARRKARAKSAPCREGAESETRVPIEKQKHSRMDYNVWQFQISDSVQNLRALEYQYYCYKRFSSTKSTSRRIENCTTASRASLARHFSRLAKAARLLLRRLRDPITVVAVKFENAMTAQNSWTD